MASCSPIASSPLVSAACTALAVTAILHPGGKKLTRQREQYPLLRFNAMTCSCVVVRYRDWLPLLASCRPLRSLCCGHFFEVCQLALDHQVLNHPRPDACQFLINPAFDFVEGSLGMPFAPVVHLITGFSERTYPAILLLHVFYPPLSLACNHLFAFAQGSLQMLLPLIVHLFIEFWQWHCSIASLLHPCSLPSSPPIISSTISPRTLSCCRQPVTGVSLSDLYRASILGEQTRNVVVVRKGKHDQDCCYWCWSIRHCDDEGTY